MKSPKNYAYYSARACFVEVEEINNLFFSRPREGGGASYWLAKILASILARIFFSDHNHTSAP
jgi:hypothetical protein